MRKVCITGGDPGVDQFFVNNEKFDRVIVTFKHHTYYTKLTSTIKYINNKEFKDLETMYKSFVKMLNRKVPKIEYLQHLGIREIYKVCNTNIDLLLVIGLVNKKDDNFIYGNGALANVAARKLNIPIVVIDVRTYDVYMYNNVCDVYELKDITKIKYINNFIKNGVNKFAVAGESGLNRVVINYKRIEEIINLLFKEEE